MKLVTLFSVRSSAHTRLPRLQAIGASTANARSLPITSTLAWWVSVGTIYRLWPCSYGVLKMHSFGVQNRLSRTSSCVWTSRPKLRS